MEYHHSTAYYEQPDSRQTQSFGDMYTPVITTICKGTATRTIAVDGREATVAATYRWLLDLWEARKPLPWV